MSAEVTEIINQLCEKLGVAANILVPEMARYYIARLAFFTVIDSIIIIIVAIGFTKIIKKILSILSEDDAEISEIITLSFFADLIPGVLLIILLISTISSAADLIGWIASPTASAIREIASMVK